MDAQLFGINFWQTLIGDTGAGIVAAAIIALIARLGFSHWRRPKLEMDFASTAVSEKELTVLANGKTETSFTLLFRNNHKFISLKSTVYWHLVIPDYVSITVKPIGDARKHASADEVEHSASGVRHVTGHIDTPLYISSALQIPFHFTLRCDEVRAYEIGYWFSTEYGKIPAVAAKLDHDFLGAYKKIPKLKLHLPKKTEQVSARS